MRKDTYRLNSVNDLGSHLTAVRIVSIASRSFAVVRAGSTVQMLPLGVPLCSACDEEVAAGPCACERPA